MQPLATWGGIFEWIGDSSGGFLNGLAEHSALANGALNVVCDIANSHPGNYANMNSLTRSFYDRACTESGRNGFPPVSSPAFTGGQCEGVEYLLTLVAEEFRFNNPPTLRTFTHTTRGPIEIVDIRRPTGYNDPRIIGWYIKSRNTNGSIRNFTIAIGGEGVDAEVESIQIERTDNEPDNCGNIGGGGFPPSTDLDDSERSFSVDFLEDTQTFIQEPLPTGDSIKFNSEDYCLIVDSDGITIVPTDEEDANESPIEPGVCNPTAPVQCETKYPGSEPAIDIGTEYQPALDGTEEDEKTNEEELNTEAAYVLVEIATPPDKNKTVLREDPRDNTFFAGWFRWTVEINGTFFGMPEMPINKPSTIFRRPDDATGFRLHSTNGATLKTTKLVRIIPPEEEEEV